MERSRRLLQMALQGHPTAGTSTVGRIFSLVKILELDKLIVIPSEEVNKSHIQELHTVRYDGKLCRCIMIQSGDKSSMERLMEVIKRYTNIENKFKSLGMTTSDTQTNVIQQVDAGIQTEVINYHPSISHEMYTTQDNIRMPDESLFGEYAVSHDGELIKVTGIQEPPINDILMVFERDDNEPVLTFGASEESASLSEKLIESIEEPIKDTPKKKNHFCIFCKSLKSNIWRHFTLMHRNEDKVKNFMCLPIKCNERRRLEADLRRTGDAEYNKLLHKEGKAPVTIRKGVSSENTVACPNCKLLYSKLTLNRHYRICSTQQAPKNFIRIAKGLMHSEEMVVQGKQNFCLEFRQFVLPGMSEDNVNNTVMKDDLILEYGNSLSLRHAGDIKTKKNFIRAQMRSVAKLRLFASELDNSITKLEDIFHPNKWNTFIEAARLLGNVKGDVTDSSPTNIIHIGQSTVNIAKDLKAMTGITEECKAKREEIQAWIELYNRRFQSTVGKHAKKIADEKKWLKRSNLPTANDITKLTEYLKEEISASSASLEETFTMEAFDRLNKATMLHLLIFNRKRIGEVNQFKLEDFKRKQKISEECDAFKTLDESEKSVAKRFYHVYVKGKWHRAVPVLISDFHSEAIDLIISMRRVAGVGEQNPYLFANGNDSLYDVSDSLRVAALESKADHPDRLTGTNLRKQLATVSQSLNLTESDLRLLSGFLGHTVKTHLEHYRQPCDVLHAARVSKVLLALESGDITKLKGKTLTEISTEETDQSINEQFERQQPGSTTKSSTLSTPKRLRSKMLKKPTLSPQKKNKISPTMKPSPKKPSKSKQSLVKQSPTKRSPLKSSQLTQRRKIRWTEDEKKIMKESFAQHLKNETLPSFKECFKVKCMYQDALTRPVQKMKAWVNNEIRRHKRKTLYSSDEDSV